MMANKENNNSGAMVPYTNDINECQMQFATDIATIQGSISLERKLRRHVKQRKESSYFIRNANFCLETEIKYDQQKKESMLASLEAIKTRITDLKNQLLLTKAEKESAIENANNNLKKYEERWLACKSRFESIPFVKKYFDVIKEIEDTKGCIDSLVVQSKQRVDDIKSMKLELWNSDTKLIIELADYMIHKRPALLKDIAEKTKKIKENNLVYNTLPAPSPKVIIEPKRIDDTRDLSRKDFHDTLVLPKLQLLNTTFSVPVDYDQLQKNYRWPESYSTNKFDMPKEIDNNLENVYVSTYFMTPPETVKSKKYSDRKLITVLDDIKLDISGTYKILSKLKPYELHDVNVINAGVSPTVEEAENKNKVTELNEVIEEIDLTNKASQDVILPPTQYMDLTQVIEERADVNENVELSNNVPQDVTLAPSQFITLTQNSQEKRVTFNTSVTHEDLPGYVENDTKCQENDVNVSNNQLNISTASQDSYNKIKDFVFKKHKLNLSPEFTYRKNIVVSKVEDKIVSSEYFDKNVKCNEINNDTAKKLDIDELHSNNVKKPDNDIIEVNQANTSDTLLEGQKCSQKYNAPSNATSIQNIIQDTPFSMNISLNTTGYEDMDVEFPYCTDPSLLLSPTADDEPQTTNNKVDVPETVPSFMAGLNKKGCSFFASTSGNHPESETQNKSSNFNFLFGREEKPKRGGLFNMFR